MNRGQGRRRDAAGMLLLAMLLLAATVVVTLGMLRTVEITAHQLAQRSSSRPDVDIYLEAREAVITELQALPVGDRNVSYARAFDRAISPLTKAAAVYSMELDGSLANESLQQARSEEDFATGGTYQGLEDIDGNPVADGEPYDGTNDGLVHVDQDLVAVIVHLRLIGLDAQASGTVVIPVGGA